MGFVENTMLFSGFFVHTLKLLYHKEGKILKYQKEERNHRETHSHRGEKGKPTIFCSNQNFTASTTSNKHSIKQKTFQRVP
jgi:hypothetical protein